MYQYGTLTVLETNKAIEQIQDFNVNEELLRKLCTSNLNGDLLRESVQLAQYTEILSEHSTFGAIADFAHRRWVNYNSPVKMQEPKEFTKSAKSRRMPQIFVRTTSPLTGLPKIKFPQWIRQKPVEGSWRVMILRRSVDRLKTLQRIREREEIEKERMLKLTVRFRLFSFMNDFARAISAVMMFQRIRRFIMQLID